MNPLISKFVKDALTTSTGEDYDVGRILWVIAVMAGIVYAGVDLLIMHNKFDITQYGIGIGSLLAAGGGALALKANTEAK
jgi:hypothetical protein